MSERLLKSDRSSGENLPARHEEMVAVAAYFRAEHRGFREGDPVADWLEAEAEIEHLLQARPGPGMSAKQLFQDRLETELAEWDARLKELKDKAKESKAKARGELEKQFEAIAAKHATAGKKLRELRKHSEEAWEDLKEDTEKAWSEMRETMERIASRFE